MCVFAFDVCDLKRIGYAHVQTRTLCTFAHACIICAHTNRYANTCVRLLVFRRASECPQHQQPFLILLGAAVHSTMKRVIKLT